MQSHRITGKQPNQTQVMITMIDIYVITWTVNNYLWTGVHISYIFVVALPYLHKAKNVTVVVVQKRTFQFYGRGGGHQ